MSINVKEVSKFTSGLIGASSETDIGDDFATFSLDIDSEFEKGALRGIKGNYILGESGWELPRYSRWRIRFNSSTLINYAGKGFLLYGYNKTFLIYYNVNDTIPAALTSQASLKSWTVININAFGFTTKKQFADATITIINNLEPNVALKNASNINNYFTSFYTTNSDSDAFVVIRSLFVGNLSIPQSHSDDLVFGSSNLKLKTNDTTSYVIFPDKDEYGEITSPSAWSDVKDGKFVKGNGILPDSNVDDLPYGFKFLKNINQKGMSNLFGITNTSKAQLIKGLGTDSFNIKDMGSIASSSDKFNITAEQRNKNLYIGTGNSNGTNSLWLGQIDRKQLDRTYTNEDKLESNNLAPLDINNGDISVDNLVVPTLHYGLNSSNGGLAGSADIYVNPVNGNDWNNSIITTANVRSVNNWAKKCLENASVSSPTFASFKKGMIFRLDMGSNFTASSQNISTYGGSGQNVFTYLRNLKSFAKGNLESVNQTGADSSTINTTNGGSDGEELHSGDLFQLVYSPSTGTIDETATESDNDMVRFVYIGHLSSDADLEANTGTGNSNPFAHDNAKCYSGTPAYAFGHVNDNNILYRIKTTSKNITQINNDLNSIIVKDSKGSDIESAYELVDTVNLEDALGVPGFEIATIAECKSADGEGNFGGDTSNKNYYMGYGKLWIANKNEHNKLYLVDITNWDGINADENKITFREVTLDFDRIHETLISKDDTTFGKGLIRLWNGEPGNEDYDNLINGYQFEREPKEKYISSICETYSHKPHLGDGAAGGSAVGDGKWRVWVSYNKINEMPNERWDLFLYNFRPQAWQQYSGSDDTQTALGTTYVMYMFDKTPPYQECAYYNDFYAPYDKFGIGHEKPDIRHSSAISSNAADTTYGDEFYSIKGSKKRIKRNGAFGSSQIEEFDALEFRNPSGEVLSWYHPNQGSDPEKNQHTFTGGSNLGWLSEEGSYRQWENFRHCLKPHFKEWYFTGITGNLSASELGNPVAHIVSFFGKLSGKFITHSGAINSRSLNNVRQWVPRFMGSIEQYNEDIVMFSMHDSPVAFSSVSGGNNAASFTGGVLSEVQGAPNTDTSNVTTGSGVNVKFNDTEAGWRTNNSVPATLGYSKFNQYRYNHDHNGTYQLYDDAGNGLSRNGYVNTEDNENGGAYYGQDEFGHYNMITVTWASNADNNLEKKAYSDNEPDGGKHHRIYGYGIDKFRILKRLSTDANSDEGFNDSEDNIWRLEGQSLSDYDKQAETQFGTGYLTYRYPHIENPNLAGTGGNAADFGDYGDKKSGFYNTSDSDPIDIGTDANNPNGTYWDNRKAVYCWSTTALTDSVYKETDYTKNRYDYNNKFHSLVSPRCSFRKLELPAGYKLENIKNVDFISWQEIYFNTTETRHGYIISGNAEDTPIEQGMIITVIDNKAIDYNRRDGKSVSSSPGNKSNWLNSQSKAARSPIIPLQKQTYTNEKSYYNQIVSYTNYGVIFKNLNTGLADSAYGYNFGSRASQSNEDANPVNNLDIRLETYSPIIIGQNGDNTKETLSTWVRPQFEKSTTNLKSMGLFPYYKYDKLWNYWSQDERSPNNINGAPLENPNIESGFDHAVLKAGEKIEINKRPTEGWGSTAGTSFPINTLLDKAYPSTYDDSDNTINGIGSHVKLLNKSILSFGDEIPADTETIDGSEQNVGVEFKAGSKVYYKLSLTYDGFQESPLTDNEWEYPVVVDSKSLELLLKVPNAVSLSINSRVTNINIYRRTNKKDLFRLVKSVSLNQKDDIFSVTENMYEHKFNDKGTTISYEGLNGISQTLKHFTPNYSLSCQLNDFLFVSKINHPKIDNGSHILLRSKQGKFSMFDWSNDYLDLPMQPKAMAAFANRIFLFDENNLYVINPEGMYIEEKTEGIGILNSQSVIVTDDGMFFADRNNIYAHNGRNAIPIGNPILYNHSRPEWQIGYLDAIKKAESLGYTPRVIYDSIKKSIYVILQGFSEVENSLSGSYENNKSRIYSFNLTTKRWDYYNSPNTNSAIVTNKGDVVLNDGYQLYNYRIDKRNRKSFTWESKEFVMGSSNYDKVFKRLYVTGELCLLNFNNIDQTSQYQEDEESQDWGLPPNPINYETIDYNVESDEYLLNVSNASESDDLKVYVDGILKTMRVQNRKPHIGHYLANDKTGSLYTIETQLPTFETSINGLTDVDGNPIKNAFSLNKNSLPEFVDAPNSQYPSTTKQGELSELVHLHRGQYLYISGTIAGNEAKEIVKVKKVHLKWTQNDDGLNTIIDNNGVIVEVYRGLLGTKAQNWNGLNPNDVRQIRIATPILKFPSGTKGKNCKIVFNNQKSYIDSFAITYRKTRMK